MTSIYDWHSFPDALTVKCPKCQSAADFSVTASSSIARKPRHLTPKRQRMGRRIDQNLKFGLLHCSFCKIRRKHRIKWPDDAFFQVDYRGRSLWAFDRGSFNALRAFIASPDRNKFRYSGAVTFLLHVPGYFLSKKSRSEIGRKLNRFANTTG